MLQQWDAHIDAVCTHINEIADLITLAHPDLAASHQLTASCNTQII
jgi:hypothetical protein